MAEKPPHDDLFDAAFMQRRDAARKKLDALDPARRGEPLADPKRRQWFETVYELADGDAAGVPWGNLAPQPLLADWLERNPDLAGARALDVGCGLGDNAAALADRGAEVTAFDFAPGAVEWAKNRFAGKNIDFVVADLFAAPSEWREAFDLVHETYTLQALPAQLLPEMRQALADFVKPGGRLLAISRARVDTQQIDGPDIDGPPWPLARGDIEGFCACGLALESLDDTASGPAAIRYWRALFRKPVASGGG